MPDGLALLEIFIRSMNAGASLLLAFALIAKRPRSWRHGLGALFALGAGSYVIASSPPLLDLFGPWFAPFHVLSILAGVIFWCFALALFDDGFRWRWPYFIPFAMTLPLVFAHFFLPKEPSIFWYAALILARAALIFGYGHAIYVALRRANEDLIEGRRVFRVAFAIAVAIMGLIVVYAESTGADQDASHGLMLVHALAILVLTFLFGVWLIDARTDVFADAPSGAPTASQKADGPAIPAADRAAYAKLTGLMADGVWREEGLSVAGLAEKVGLAEHQLRKLINGVLGHKNFSAFLNSYRLAEARRVLSDPEQARRQVLQVALDVGFGSIAPFNRAFKDETGMTPTEFRKKALGEAQ